MDKALDGAVLLFREHGFHDASLADIGAAMQLTPGSIYKAFRDKREIFAAAFDHYTRRRHEQLKALLSSKATGREKLEAALTFLAETAHGAEGKIGCMVVGAATDISTLDAALSARVTAAANWMEGLFVELIQAGRADGSISKTIDAATTARTFLCLTQGLRVVGKTGRTRAEMMATVQQAMKLV